MPCLQLSVSGSALDLAPLQQTRPFPRGSELDNGPKTSEWPQFSGLPRTAADLGLGGHRLSTDRSRGPTRNVTISAIGSDIGGSSPDNNRRASPPSGSTTFSDIPSLSTNLGTTTTTTTSSSVRSVPPTPLSTLSNPNVLRSDLGIGMPSMKSNGDAHQYDSGYGGGRSPYETLTFGSIRGDDSIPSLVSNSPLHLSQTMSSATFHSFQF
jgi:hypothetical protein